MSHSATDFHILYAHSLRIHRAVVTVFFRLKTDVVGYDFIAPGKTSAPRNPSLHPSANQASRPRGCPYRRIHKGRQTFLALPAISRRINDSKSINRVLPVPTVAERHKPQEIRETETHLPTP